jgi:hypothetical protein
VTRDGTAGAADPADPVAAAAADLYGLPLGQFTAARAERARQARSGDPAAARAIGRLAKPSVVAWLANQLARDDPAGISALLDLGTAMRAATAALDAAELRQLSRRQHDLVQGLAARARDRAAGAGLGFSPATERGLTETLHAALADEQAAAQLAAGRLTAALSRSGFPGLDARAADAAAWAAPAPAPASGRRAARTPAEPPTGPPASGHRPAGTPAGPPTAPPAEPGAPGGSAARARDRRAEQAAARAAAAEAARREQLERARRDEAEAQRDAGDAAAELDRARAALAGAQDAADQAAADITRLQDALDAAMAARDTAGRTQRRARQGVDRAERADRQARRRLDAAAARRAGLERPPP